MGERLKAAVYHNTWFWVLTIVSILLIIAAFIVPPTAVIDGSVLAAVGELAGFAAIGTVIKAMDMGIDARVKHNNTSLTVGDLNKYPDNPNNYQIDDILESGEEE